VHINNGISNLTVGDIEMHPTNPDILLAATGRLNGFGGGPDAELGELLRSVDGGATWSQRYGNVRGILFTYVEFDETNPDIVYAAASDRGFFKSTDGGKSWFETTYNPPYINPGHVISITTHKAQPDWLITNSYGGGVFVSRDGAKNWKDASKGYTGSEMSDIDVALDDPLKVYAVARSSVFSSDNGGTNWYGIGAMFTSYNNVPIGPLEMRSIAIHPSETKIVFATNQESSIFKTTNGGLNWKTVFSFPDHDAQTIEFSPSNPDILYAGATVHGGYKIDRPFPFNPTKMSYGIVKSINKGENWTYINNGLESTYKNVNCIAVHPTDPELVYIGTLNSGIYKTVDGGNLWFKSSDGLIVSDVRTIAIDYANPNVLYAGTQRGGVYKSTDAGQNWLPILYGMDPEAAIRSVVIDPTNSQTVYAGDWLSGVYRSLDAGQTWYHINKGLRTRAVHKLALSKDGKVLYAATQGEGVFRLHLGENQGPHIISHTPSNQDTLSFTKEETTTFEIESFDIDGDTLQYRWYLDELSLPDIVGETLVLEMDSLIIGLHVLECEISDGIHTKEVVWNFWVAESTEITGNPKSIIFKYSLEQNYPNPFNAVTRIQFELPKMTKVYLEIFNILGEKIKILVDENKPRGIYSVTWDGRIDNGEMAPSGIFLYRLKTEDFEKTNKLLFLK
jgi:photosystem II stability/assembly factor-like uncharacterized protein